MIYNPFYELCPKEVRRTLKILHQMAHVKKHAPFDAKLLKCVRPFWNTKH